MTEEAAENEGMNQNLRQEGLRDRIILETISNNGHEREVVARLRSGHSHQDIADWLLQVNPELVTRIGRDGVSRRRLVDVVRGFEAQFEDDGLHRSDTGVLQHSWTEVSNNSGLIGHLFDLYFTWIHPVHMLFNENDFKRDFRLRQETHCSATLVNAICAMACSLHDKETMTHSWNVSNDTSALRDAFMGEAKNTTMRISKERMTTIQAFAVMYLVELSAGKARNASSYLRVAVDSMVKANARDPNPQSPESREVTLLGLQTLNTCVILLLSFDFADASQCLGWIDLSETIHRTRAEGP